MERIPLSLVSVGGCFRLVGCAVPCTATVYEYEADQIYGLETHLSIVHRALRLGVLTSTHDHTNTYRYLYNYLYQLFYPFHRTTHRIQVQEQNGHSTAWHRHAKGTSRNIFELRAVLRSMTEVVS